MIEIKNLSKRFNKIEALDDLSISIKDRQVTALWGSNGAGKTTLIRCLLGVTPFTGEIVINKKDLRSNDKLIKRSVGFVPQEISLHDNLTVGETINFYSKLKNTEAGSIGKLSEIIGINNF